MKCKAIYGFCVSTIIDAEVRQLFDGHAVFRGSPAAKSRDYRTVQYTASVAAGQKNDLPYEIVLHQGRNAKQSYVTVEQAEVKP